MFSADLKVTAAGRALLAKCQNGETMHFTRVKVGSGSIGETEPDKFTDVITEEKAFDIVYLRRSEETTYVKFVLRNDSAVAYYFRELALMAEDPDAGEISFLYANDGDNAELIETTPLEREITIAIPVSKLGTVEVVIPSSSTITREEFEEHTENSGIHITEEERKRWNEKVGTGENGKIALSYLPNVEDLGGYKKESILSEKSKTIFGLGSDAGPNDVWPIIKNNADSQAKEIVDLKNRWQSNTKTACGTYTGSGLFGKNNKNRISVGFRPDMLLLGYAGMANAVTVIRGQTSALYVTTSNSAVMGGLLMMSRGEITVEWGDTYVEWYSEESASIQLNYQGSQVAYFIAGQ